MPDLEMTPGVDVEVYGTGPYVWHTYSGRRLIDTGNARTKLGLNLSLFIRRAVRAMKNSRTT